MTYNYTENGIAGIWDRNFSFLNDTFDTRGFIYFIAILFVFALSLVSSLVYIFSGLWKSEKRSERGVGLSGLNSSNVASFSPSPMSVIKNRYKSSEECSPLYTTEQMENIHTINKLEVPPSLETMEKAFARETAGKLNAIGQAGCTLRENIYRNKMTLKGKVLRVSYPKVGTSNEGTFNSDSFFVTQRVTFGNDLNIALKTFFKDDIKLRRLKGQESTYIVFNGEEIVKLEGMIAKAFMLDGFKIALERNRND